MPRSSAAQRLRRHRRGGLGGGFVRPRERGEGRSVYVAPADSAPRQLLEAIVRRLDSRFADFGPFSAAMDAAYASVLAGRRLDEAQHAQAWSCAADVAAGFKAGEALLFRKADGAAKGGA